MPELAELKFTADYVNQVSEGTEYVSVNKNPEHKCEDLDIPFKSYRIKAESKGKEMVLAILVNNSDQIIPIRMTMGMSGYFKLTNSGQEPKHSHLKFNRKDGTTLSFVDVRRFGKWKQGLWWNDTRGEDPTTSFDSFWKDIMTNLTSRAFKKPLYEVLMNQKYFNGIGNYLRAEIIYRAGNVDPFLPAAWQLVKYPKSWNFVEIFQCWHMQKEEEALEIGIIHLDKMLFKKNLCYVMEILLCRKEKIRMEEHFGMILNGTMFLRVETI